VNNTLKTGPSLGELSPDEKREYLHVLSDAVWDIEAELAMVRAERAALMTSIQADLRRPGSNRRLGQHIRPLGPVRQETP
jgi:hypothetical protein